MVRYLYGFNSTGSTFRNHLVDCMHHLVFFPCPVNLDIWMKPMVRHEDEFDYYVYFLIYVDDVMVTHRDVESVFQRIDMYFKLKSIFIGDPDIYLGS